MTHLTRKEQTRAIITAEHDGQAYCPNCNRSLNYDRGGLPNSAVYDQSTDTVTCSRCARRPKPAARPAPRRTTTPEPTAPADTRLAYTSFTG